MLLFLLKARDVFWSTDDRGIQKLRLPLREIPPDHATQYPQPASPPAHEPAADPAGTLVAPGGTNGGIEKETCL